MRGPAERTGHEPRHRHFHPACRIRAQTARAPTIWLAAGSTGLTPSAFSALPRQLRCSRFGRGSSVGPDFVSLRRHLCLRHARHQSLLPPTSDSPQLRMPEMARARLAILGVCCLQDTPARWVGVHRLHHQFSDEPPDPHSPLVTFLWGHVGWLLVPDHELSPACNSTNGMRKICSRDAFVHETRARFLWVWINLAQWAVFYLVGLLIGLATTSAIGASRFNLD